MQDFLVTSLILFLAGLVAGTLNVIAGGGSLLSLPVMIFLGLPPTVANGTNRVAILIQNIGASWSFNRRGLLSREWLLIAVPPALVGAVVGTVAAVNIGELEFQRVLAVVLAFTPLALALFAWNGKVDWAMGFALAAGNFLGGLAGVHLQVLKGHKWVRGVVTLVIVIFAVRLLFVA